MADRWMRAGRLRNLDSLCADISSAYCPGEIGDAWIKFGEYRHPKGDPTPTRGVGLVRNRRADRDRGRR